MVPAWNDSVPPVGGPQLVNRATLVAALVLSTSASSMEGRHAPVGVSPVLIGLAELIATLVLSAAASRFCRCTAMHSTS